MLSRRGHRRYTQFIYDRWHDIALHGVSKDKSRLLGRLFGEQMISVCNSCFSISSSESSL